MLKAATASPVAQTIRVTHRERLGERLEDETRIDVTEVGVGQIETVVTAGRITSRGRRAFWIEDQVVIAPGPRYVTMNEFGVVYARAWIQSEVSFDRKS